MERVLRHRSKGLTLIEVMISMLAMLVIVIGVISYMYASARHARAADVRIAATRIGQLCLDGWKITGTVDKNGIWDVDAFDPTADSFDSILPNAIVSGSGLAGVGTELGRYETTIDGAHYFITLSYRNDIPGSQKLFLLNACVAWNRNYSSTFSDLVSVWLTSYSIY